MTLVHLRTGLTHAALGEIYEVASSAIGRAISEIRPLLAARGFAVPDRPGAFGYGRWRTCSPMPWPRTLR
ncbi:transposase family protein [Streptomyces sp. NPDC006678]|uniref:transposase family protein n=1 Tax=unclassified Streptomyces TaxID=2593676 RepID=UPI0033AD1B7E